MQGVQCRPLPNAAAVGVDQLASAAAAKRAAAAAAAAAAAVSPLSIDGAETPEKRIERLIMENPVIIFSRSSCCMCHVMRRLLAAVGAHPLVIELDDDEMDRAVESLALSAAAGSTAAAAAAAAVTPAVFIGGALVGGLESLMALHLSGHLVPRLREVGALYV